jgi:hypothetical protein
LEKLKILAGVSEFFNDDRMAVTFTGSRISTFKVSESFAKAKDADKTKKRKAIVLYMF